MNWCLCIRGRDFERSILQMPGVCTRSIMRINYKSDTDSLNFWHWQFKLLIYVIRQSTDRPPTLDRYSMVKKSAECRPLYRPTYLSSLGRHSGRHTGRHIGGHINRCSTNTPRPICRSTSRPAYRSSLDQYVGRDVDRHISQDVGREVHKLHMIQNNYVYYENLNNFETRLHNNVQLCCILFL